LRARRGTVQAPEKFLETGEVVVRHPADLGGQRAELLGSSGRVHPVGEFT
jgi:hypothetical protein